MTVMGTLCGAALAQEAPASSDAADAMIGTWEFSNADRDKVCRLAFRADALGAGHRLDVDKSCAALFPAIRDAVAWTIDAYGTLRLLDGRGDVAIELAEVESGIFDGFQPGQGRYVLQSAAAAPPRSADDMVGDWAVALGTGKPICTLTLATTPAAAGGPGGADAMGLTVKPGCDALVMRFAPTAWRIDQGELVLLSARGRPWRFEENDANTWQRMPESADQILLVRQ